MKFLKTGAVVQLAPIKRREEEEEEEEEERIK